MLDVVSNFLQVTSPSVGTSSWWTKSPTQRVDFARRKENWRRHTTSSHRVQHSSWRGGRRLPLRPPELVWDKSSNLSSYQKSKTSWSIKTESPEHLATILCEASVGKSSRRINTQHSSTSTTYSTQPPISSTSHTSYRTICKFVYNDRRQNLSIFKRTRIIKMLQPIA